MSLAVQFSEYGTSEVLRVVDVPAPAPGPGQVRLAVRAAGVNPVDWKIMPLRAAADRSTPRHQRQS
jgi:NADPH:quinone reductase-like Zn-dependent oxidoreductase